MPNQPITRVSEGVEVLSEPSPVKPIQNLDEINDRFKRRPVIFLGLFFGTYFITAILIYTYWTGWTAFEALYFAVTTLETIGYGDFAPKTPSQRLFTCFFLMIGVGFCGSTMVVLRTLLAEHQARLRNLKSAQMFTKFGENIIMIRESQLDIEQAGSMSITSTESEHNSEFGGAMNPSVSVTPRVPLRRKDSLLDMVSTSFKKATRRFTTATGYSFDDESPADIANANITVMRTAFLDAYKVELHDLQVSAIWNLVIIIVIIGFGTGIMCAIEGWDFIKSCYWACVTILTVGFGDVVPATNLGRGFTMVYCLFGCAYMAKSFQDFANVPVVMRLKKNENKVINQFTQDLSKQKLERIFNNEFFKRVPRLRRWNNEMSKSEFVLMVLNLMNKVEEKDIMLVAEVFERLDNGKGFLSNEEMQEKVANAIDEDIVGNRPDAEDEDVLDTLSNITATVTNTVNNAFSRVSIAFMDSDTSWMRPSMAPGATGDGSPGRFSIFGRKSQANVKASNNTTSSTNTNNNQETVTNPMQPRKVRSRRDSAATSTTTSTASSTTSATVSSTSPSSTTAKPPSPGKPITSPIRSSTGAVASNSSSTSSSPPPSSSPTPAHRRGSAFGVMPSKHVGNNDDKEAFEPEIELSTIESTVSDDTAWMVNPINSKRSNSNKPVLQIDNHAPSFGRPPSSSSSSSSSSSLSSSKTDNHNSARRVLGTSTSNLELIETERDDRSSSAAIGSNSGRLSPLRMPSQKREDKTITPENQSSSSTSTSSKIHVTSEAKDLLERLSDADNPS